MVPCRGASRQSLGCASVTSATCRWCPRQDSNLRAWLRRPLLYPLSYGGPGEQNLSSRPCSHRSVLSGEEAGVEIQGARPRGG